MVWEQVHSDWINVLSRSLIPAIMDNFKCLIAFSCDVLNKKDNNVYVDLIDAYETLHRELTKSMKIVEKFKE